LCEKEPVVSNPTLPVPSEKPHQHPEPLLDPFGLPVLPGDLMDWPPADPAELAALDAWADACEREAAGRE
jgi:hypothetical protein